MGRPKGSKNHTSEAQAAEAVAPLRDVTAPTRVSVINRRLANPFGTPSRDIPLRGDKARGWVVRTFATDPEHPNRHYDAVHRLGWTPLRPSDLAVSAESLGYSVSPDGRIIRGPKGAEVLMAMPEDDWQAVQKAKSDENLRKLSPAYTRNEVAQAVAKDEGAEAGETVYNAFEQRDVEETITVGGS